MNRTRIFFYQVLGWLLIIGYDLWWILRDTTETGAALQRSLLLQVTFLLSSISLFYYCYLLVFSQGMRKGHWQVLVLGLLGAPVVFAATRYLLEEVMLPLFFGFRNYTPGTTLTYYLLDNAYYLPPMMVAAAAVWGVKDAFLREKARENHLRLQVLEQEKMQAELAFLRTQINPHFLYNTLNYIYSLAYPVSEPLAEAILKLSELMRYMLHESPDGKVELQKEVDYLHHYLAIYRLRFEGNFFVDFQCDGRANGQRVAALLLIPFVENALKHGVLDEASQPMEIRLTLPATTPGLTFEVRNHISQHQKDATTGIGLGNIRRRLELLYPGKHQLVVQQEAAVHYTRLELYSLH
ncbi:histidine kinase [Hymenobacter tibetensis]|uniref:Histidine kinase n=1 Tax=Hymenobacter tibetensis TaxID=497967 RepID=A0ABY4CZX2_9BACT|nr:histidine kinase [Hymenobacter tibetensis]UOG75129.1 histidine kinase [Hymenobacter tibetensis]